jgi:hypothetical protein
VQDSILGLKEPLADVSAKLAVQIEQLLGFGLEEVFVLTALDDLHGVTVVAVNRFNQPGCFSTVSPGMPTISKPIVRSSGDKSLQSNFDRCARNRLPRWRLQKSSVSFR